MCSRAAHILSLPASIYQSDSIVPVEVIIAIKVLLDRLEVDEHVIELLEEEEAGCHALSAGNGIALTRAGSHELEELLRHA